MKEDIFEMIDILNSFDRINDLYSKIKEERNYFKKTMVSIDKNIDAYKKFIKNLDKNMNAIYLKIFFIKDFYDNFGLEETKIILGLKELQKYKTILNFIQLKFKFTDEEIILMAQLIRNEIVGLMFKESLNEVLEENENLREELKENEDLKKQLEHKIMIYEDQDNYKINLHKQ